MNAGDFWRFSLRVYARPRIEAIGLELQERYGLDVNLLLFACWLGTRGVRLTADRLRALEEAVGPWRARAVLPLRAVRRDLKTWLENLSPDLPVVRGEAGGVREQVKRAELQAEKVEQHMLAAVAAGWPDDAGGGPELIEGNLMIVHDFRARRHDLRALVEASFA